MNRKEAIREYKERKVARGVFAIRCAPTGSVWVDSAMDLDAAENRVWFALRLGDKFMEKTIVAQYGSHGRDAFSYEVLETIDGDTPQMSLRDLLKERKLHWVEKLQAHKLSPA